MSIDSIASRLNRIERNILICLIAIFPLSYTFLFVYLEPFASYGDVDKIILVTALDFAITLSLFFPLITFFNGSLNSNQVKVMIVVYYLYNFVMFMYFSIFDKDLLGIVLLFLLGYIAVIGSTYAYYRKIRKRTMTPV